MNILNFFKDLFDFKSVAKKIFTKENFEEICNFAKNQIVIFVGKNDLLGKEKKEKVDKKVIAFLQEKLHSDNGFVKFIINLLIAIVPAITQFIYDTLKARVDGLTVEKEV